MYASCVMSCDMLQHAIRGFSVPPFVAPPASREGLRMPLGVLTNPAQQKGTRGGGTGSGLVLCCCASAPPSPCLLSLLLLLLAHLLPSSLLSNRVTLLCVSSHLRSPGPAAHRTRRARCSARRARFLFLALPCHRRILRLRRCSRPLPDASPPRPSFALFSSSTAAACASAAVSSASSPRHMCLATLSP